MIVVDKVESEQVNEFVYLDMFWSGMQRADIERRMCTWNRVNGPLDNLFKSTISIHDTRLHNYMFIPTLCYQEKKRWDRNKNMWLNTRRPLKRCLEWKCKCKNGEVQISIVKWRKNGRWKIKKHLYNENVDGCI